MCEADGRDKESFNVNRGFDLATQLRWTGAHYKLTNCSLIPCRPHPAFHHLEYGKPSSCLIDGKMGGVWEWGQWRSQNTADARAQNGHTTSSSRLVPRPHPAFCRLRYETSEATWGCGGMLPQKILEFLSFPGRLWGYFRTYHRLESGVPLRLCLRYKPARPQRKVTVVLTANTHTWDQESIQDLVILRIQIAILHSSISIPLCTFSAQSVIDNGTFGTDQEFSGGSALVGHSL